jgi:hypothetical protein
MSALIDHLELVAVLGDRHVAGARHGNDRKYRALRRPAF